MKLTRCFLCGSDDAHVIHKGTRGKDCVDVLQCDSCGLVRLSEVVDDIDNFYENSGMRNKVQQPIEVIRRNTRIDDERRYRFTEKMIENKSILDFGCGAGGFLLRAKKAAKQVYGVELEKAVRDTLVKEGVKCYTSLADIGRVDVITLFHVLEHLEDPLSYLAEFKKHLEPDGYILIEVPNADDALLSLYQNVNFADFTYWSCHLYLYTLATLRRLAKKAGFKVGFIKQIQRYSLANHLYWLSRGKPGGHYTWSFMENSELDQRYGEMLANLGIADTIIAKLEVE